GPFLPPVVSVSLLEGLALVAGETNVPKPYCLGDSFHDRFGCERLPDQARALLTAMTDKLDWTWIVGKHDPGFADHCGGTLVEEVEVADIILRHEAIRDDLRPELSGHFH